ncbi:MAG: hypothetical protein ABI641_11490, partial [Caldimonas sp.]
MTTTAIGWFIALAIGVAALLGALITGLVLVRQQRLANALAESRHRIGVLHALLGPGRWQTNREHRLVDPLGGGAGTEPALFWQQFQGDDAARIRRQMVDAEPLDDLEVSPADGDEGARRIVLRARPVFDSAGTFAGYAG